MRVYQIFYKKFRFRILIINEETGYMSNLDLVFIHKINTSLQNLLSSVDRAGKDFFNTS